MLADGRGRQVRRELAPDGAEDVVRQLAGVPVQGRQHAHRQRPAQPLDQRADRGELPLGPAQGEVAGLDRHQHLVG
ncbi:MAG: hypothetical protein ACKOGJ_12535, partial [Phycisphaerales bacterium]